MYNKVGEEMPSMNTEKIKFAGIYLQELPDCYCVIDIETTGLCHIKNEIIELSALKVKDNNVVEKFSSLVKPKELIKTGITNLTGITNAMVKNEREIDVVLREFCNFVGKNVVVGHNVSFDLRFIKSACKKCFDKEFVNDYSDSLKLARRILPNFGSYRLENLAKHFSIDTTGHHRGLVDCEITFEVIQKLLSLPQEILRN